MRVLVTGATGFIGAHLCRRLTSNGHTVVAQVRDAAKAVALPKAGVEAALSKTVQGYEKVGWL